MKIFTFITITIALLCATFLSAQNVPNGGFENWTDNEPDDWGTTNIPGSDVITKSIDAFSGSFAARGQSIEVNRDNLPVEMVADGPPEGLRVGFPISPQQFTRMTFRYKLDNGNNDHLVAIVSIRNTDSLTMGLGSIVIEDKSTDSWSLATVLIDYTEVGGTPGFAVVQFVLEDRTGGDPPSRDAFFIIDDVELSLATAINDDNPIVPDKSHLYNNYPNPFNPETTIKYHLAKSSQVRLIIYNQLGQVVTTLVNEHQSAGAKTVSWDGMDISGTQLSSGVYIYRIEAGDFVASKKMMLLK